MYILMSPRFFIWKCFPVFIGTFPLETVLEDCQNRPLFNQSYSTSIFVIKIQFGVSTFIGFPFITISFFS